MTFKRRRKLDPSSRDKSPVPPQNPSHNTSSLIAPHLKAAPHHDSKHRRTQSAHRHHYHSNSAPLITISPSALHSSYSSSSSSSALLPSHSQLIHIPQSKSIIPFQSSSDIFPSSNNSSLVNLVENSSSLQNKELVWYDPNMRNQVYYDHNNGEFVVWEGNKRLKNSQGAATPTHTESKDRAIVPVTRKDIVSSATADKLLPVDPDQDSADSDVDVDQAIENEHADSIEYFPTTCPYCHRSLYGKNSHNKHTDEKTTNQASTQHDRYHDISQNQNMSSLHLSHPGGVSSRYYNSQNVGKHSRNDGMVTKDTILQQSEIFTSPLYFRLLLENHQQQRRALMPQLQNGDGDGDGDGDTHLPTTTTNDHHESANTSKIKHENQHLSHDSLNTGYYRKFFVERKRLGAGSFGTVYYCEHFLDGVRLSDYAIKIVPVGDDHKWLERVLREVDFLQMLHHPNIIDYKHSWLELHRISEFAPQVPFLFILMEYANAGNLASYLGIEDTLNKNILRESEIISFFEKICNGIEHLHSNNIIHCDLKPENILLHRNTSASTTDDVPQNRSIIDEYHPLISDFGVSRKSVVDQNLQSRTGNTGTIPYIPPEMLLYDSVPDKKSDIWALGAILYVLSFSTVPFNSENVEDSCEMIKNATEIIFPEFPNRSEKLTSIISTLMSWNPEDRPSIYEVKKLVSDMQQEQADETIQDHSPVSPVARRTPPPPSASPRVPLLLRDREEDHVQKFQEPAKSNRLKLAFKILALSIRIESMYILCHSKKYCGPSILPTLAISGLALAEPTLLPEGHFENKRKKILGIIALKWVILVVILIFQSGCKCSSKDFSFTSEYRFLEWMALNFIASILEIRINK